MIKNGITYNKVLRNGLTYNKAFLNNVQVLGESLILNIPFNNSINNIAQSGVNMVLAGLEPTYTTGRKGNDVCAVFTGTRSIKTAVNLPLNSDKVSVSLWLKTSATATQCIFESSENLTTNLNTFACLNNNPTPNYITIFDRGQNAVGNRVRSSISINDNTWKHLVFTIDRSLGLNQNKLYVNGFESIVSVLEGDVNGNFSNNYIFYIGQRGGTGIGFVGQMQEFKLWNRILSQQEITALYNA